MPNRQIVVCAACQVSWMKRQYVEPPWICPSCRPDIQVDKQAA